MWIVSHRGRTLPTPALCPATLVQAGVVLAIVCLRDAAVTTGARTAPVYPPDLRSAATPKWSLRRRSGASPGGHMGSQRPGARVRRRSVAWLFARVPPAVPRLVRERRHESIALVGDPLDEGGSPRA